VVDSSGRVLGTYLHGLFDEAGFRAAFLDALWKSSGKKRTGRGPAAPSASVIKERNYNRLATLLKDHLDPGFLESWLNLSVRSY